jgi:hypothetical protein
MVFHLNNLAVYKLPATRDEANGKLCATNINCQG